MFRCWLSTSRAILIAIVCSFFSFLDIPVFWPILVLYFIILFVFTMKRQIIVRPPLVTICLRLSLSTERNFHLYCCILLCAAYDQTPVHPVLARQAALHRRESAAACGRRREPARRRAHVLLARLLRAPPAADELGRRRWCGCGRRRGRLVPLVGRVVAAGAAAEARQQPRPAPVRTALRRPAPRAQQSGQRLSADTHTGERLAASGDT